MTNEYIPKGEPDEPLARRQLWDTAIGLQETDGLVVSGYLRDLADRNVARDVTLGEVEVLLQEHYREKRSRTAEADMVSQRIVLVLEEGSFTYDAAFVRVLHRRLFSGIDDERLRPGEYRDENLVKTEPVLNGDSVLYCDHALIQRQLEATFRKDGRYDYAIPMGHPIPEEDLGELCWFMKNVWYAHPFWEGNTRTVAVLAELYLRTLGYEVDNVPFEDHSALFRDCLVRALYHNGRLGVARDDGYLRDFMRSVTNGMPLQVRRADLLCEALFNHPDKVVNVNLGDARRMRDELDDELGEKVKGETERGERSA